MSESCPSTSLEPYFNSITACHILSTNVVLQYSSHYVTFIRKTIPNENEDGSKEEEEEEAWVLFNDEKVVKAEGDVEEMKKFAYVYFFERL